MNALGFSLVSALLVASVAAQYDYTPPQRQFNAGGQQQQKERPTYGLPGHTPGQPQGESELQREGPSGYSSPAVAGPPQPVREQISIPAPVPVRDSGYTSAPAPIRQSGGFASAPAPFRQSGGFASAPAPIRQSGGFSSAPAPIRQSGGFASAPAPIRQSGGFSSAPAPEESYTPQVFRHVYVHTAPDEPVDTQSRTIRVPGGDKHVNIIFVKTPSQDSSSQTEVILPEQDEHKNLVYVLLKKGSAENDIKIRRPAAPAQRKPEVYFIRYGDGQKETGEQSGGYSPPIRSNPSTSSGYGVPL